MRRRSVASPYLILGLVLFCWASLPKPFADEMRSFSVAALAPSWKWAKGIKRYLSDRPERFWNQKKEADSSEVLRLQLENRTLRAQLEKVSEWLASEQRIKGQLEIFQGISREVDRAQDAHWLAFFQRRAAHLRDLLRWELMSMPAKAIYRDPGSWSSSIWVNVGEDDNRTLGRTVIAKNSPVVSGIALVGVVDYVGKRQSRVRLITDSGLSPSVRAVRGAAQNREIASLAGSLLDCLDEKSPLANQLKELKGNLGDAWEEGYLAKGELQGSSAPFWRSRSPSLKGIGFNFDYADEEGSGPAGIPIIKEGDLLVTSGLDGVFPPDLVVARVSKIFPFKPGGYAYEIEARPAAAHLNDLDALFILPPQSD